MVKRGGAAGRELETEARQVLSAAGWQVRVMRARKRERD